MAADAGWWRAFTATHPFAYHATTRDRLDSIARHGLVPWDDERGVGYSQFSTVGEPRPGHVYFSLKEPVFYGDTILRVPSARLDPLRIALDEDALPARLSVEQVSRHVAGKDWMSLGKVAEQTGWGDDPAITQWFLENGASTIAYHGTVPPAGFQFIAGEVADDLRTSLDEYNRSLLNLDRLMSLALSVATDASAASPLHGPQHWHTVALLGELLAKRAGADHHVVRIFAVLHDAQRHSDGDDPLHGVRAAQLARSLNRVLKLDARRLAVLEHALTWHADGFTSNNPTIGACWDADRLDLWRVGSAPNPDLMSTSAGRELSAERPERLGVLATEVQENLRARPLVAEDVWQPVVG